VTNARNDGKKVSYNYIAKDPKSGFRQLGRGAYAFTEPANLVNGAQGEQKNEENQHGSGN
jgi:hypothetical protein